MSKTTAPVANKTYDLERFVVAQQPVMERVFAELHAGRKQSHWMWFVFPQLKGLGLSSTAQCFGIVTLGEARAYLTHSTLGPRLAECTNIVRQHHSASLHEIFGSPDNLKFQSCMTLFAQAIGKSGSVFEEALVQFCEGRPDQKTLEILGC